jgi:hypothetical protein
MSQSQKALEKMAQASDLSAQTRKRKMQEVVPAIQLPCISIPPKKTLQNFANLDMETLRVSSTGHVMTGKTRLPEQELSRGKGKWCSLPFGFKTGDGTFKEAPHFISGQGKNKDNYLQLSIDVKPDLAERLEAFDNQVKQLCHDPTHKWSPLVTEGKLRANVLLGAETAPGELTSITICAPDEFEVMQRHTAVGWEEVKHFAEEHRLFKGCPVKPVIRADHAFKWQGYQGLTVRLVQLAIDCDPDHRRSSQMPAVERAEAMDLDDLF